MTSFQISIAPTKRAAGRFIAHVRRELVRALAEEGAKRGINQSVLAREIGVHRSVINRELRGYKDMTLGRVAELASVMGCHIRFELEPEQVDARANEQPQFRTESVATTLNLPPQTEEFQFQATIGTHR